MKQTTVLPRTTDEQTVAQRISLSDIPSETRIEVPLFYEAVVDDTRELRVLLPGKYRLDDYLHLQKKGLFSAPVFEGTVYFVRKSCRFSSTWGRQLKTRDPVTKTPVTAGVHGRLTLGVGDARTLVGRCAGAQGTVLFEEMVRGELGALIAALDERLLRQMEAYATLTQMAQALPIDCAGDAFRFSLGKTLAVRGMTLEQFSVEGEPLLKEENQDL